MKKKTKKIQCVIIATQKSTSNKLCLLLQTNKRRGLFWQNVTGKVEKNEDFEEAVLREVMEETHFPETLLESLINLEMTHFFTDQYEREVEEKAFLLLAKDTWEPKLDPNEHESYRWIDIKEIKRSSVKFEGNYEVLKAAINFLNNDRKA